MSWLTLTIIAQFLNSIVALFDKYFVTSKKITTPILYVFYTGFLTALGILLYVPALFIKTLGLPQFSNIEMLGMLTFSAIATASLSQLVALWALFSALKKNDASDVVPVIGSLSAICALVIGFVFGATSLPFHFTIGFALLVTGTLLISHFRFSITTFLLTLLAGLGFALHGLLLKVALSNSSFDTGFFWFACITSVFSLMLFAFRPVRKAFFSQTKEKHIKSTGALLIGNKVIAGIAGILLIKAIEIGEVSLVQALGGLQFVFLFLLAVIFGRVTSIDFGENMTRKDIYHKLISIGIISAGFVLLFI